MAIELSNEPSQEPAASCKTAISCLVQLNAQGDRAAGIETARRLGDLDGESVPLSRLVKLAAEFGLRAEWMQLDWQGLKATGFTHPLLIVRKNTDVVIVTGGGRFEAEEVSVWDPYHDGVVFFVPREDFERAWNGHALVITPGDQGAEVLKLQPGRKAVFDTGGDTPPTPPDVPKQQTPPSPLRVAKASTLNRHVTTPRSSLSRRLCFAAFAILATASISVFLLTYRDPDDVAAISTPARVNSARTQSTSMNREKAVLPLGVGASAPAGPTPKTAWSAARPTSAEPAETPTEASPAAHPAEAAPSALTAPTAQMPETLTDATSVSAALPVEAAPSAVTAPAPQMPETMTLATPVPAVLSAAEIAALVARGDTLFTKGDLAAARLFYEHAANAGDGRAAVRLGESFDPVFLDHAHLRGVRGDVGTALFWYRRARDLGAAEAEILMKGLELK